MGGTDELEGVLSKYWGYSGFRDGQREVISAVVNDARDTCVYWATGSGKSLCFQLPALLWEDRHRAGSQGAGFVVVVSPLISLMHDQVIQLNSTCGEAAGGDVACFLGSAQKDSSVEGRALGGGFALVYVTPEKIESGFLAALKAARGDGGARRRVRLVAVDESHSISQWGHDFRPSYRKLKALRDELPGVPIMALTATAVPRVRADIASELRLSASRVESLHSFDRPNLRLQVRQPVGSKAQCAQAIANRIEAAGGSAVVYVPTTGLAESMAGLLAGLLPEANVMAYHGKQPPEEREAAHRRFIVGKCRAVVATLAFGMGIDKPDIRLVVHYGAPKTVEEYYQQIGRAGRDGRPSDCLMLAKPSDFSRYESDFYESGLDADARAAQRAGIELLRKFASEPSKCRRRQLLDFFGEPARFDRCGSCDNCESVREHGDERRDVRTPARALFLALQGRTDPITRVLARLREAPAADALLAVVQAHQRTEPFMRELLAALVTAGYVQTASVKGGFAAYSTYTLSPAGRAALADASSPVLVSVTPSMRENERAAAEARRELIERLREGGVDVSEVPSDELDCGRGPVLAALKQWAHSLRTWRSTGREAEARAREELLARVMQWRDRVADELGMPPVAVLAPHMARIVAYTLPRDAQALRDAGVRISRVAELAALVALSVDELGLDAGRKRARLDDSGPVGLPAGVFTPARPWKARSESSRVLAWEKSFDRFAAGERIEAIAMKQPSGKPVLAQTVVGHLLTALVHGRPIDLTRVALSAPGLPTRAEWAQLEEASSAAGYDVLSHAGEGRPGVLLHIVGPSFALTRDERTQEDAAIISSWYPKLAWWEALKRANVPIS